MTTPPPPPPPQQQQQQQQHQRSTMKLDLPTLKSTEIEHAKPGPQSPQLEKDAARAVSHTADWQPSLASRRESYRQEDRRHELTMGSVAGTKNRAAQGMGFSEGRNA